MKKLLLALAFFGVSSVIFAAAPIVDYSSDADPASIVGSDDEIAQTTPVDSDTVVADDSARSSRVNLGVAQRLQKLERQVDNLNQQNTTAKIDDLQERMQKLNGQLEDQAHQIAQLNEQVKSFYQDLNQRIEGNGANVSTALTSMSISQMAKASNQTDSAPMVPSATAKGKAAPLAVVKKPSQLAADTAFLKEQQMYQTAIDLLPDKKYDESAKKLHAYLGAYPKGVYIANAHYWLGEINFLQKNMDQAEAEFKIVVTKYPTAKKVSDALLKIALIHDVQNKREQAKDELRQIIKKYPNTAAAQLAKQQLETD